MRSFVLVLACITVANIKYKGCTISISPCRRLLSDSRMMVKEIVTYIFRRSSTQRAFAGHYPCMRVVRQMIRYYHASLLDMEPTSQTL